MKHLRHPERERLAAIARDWPRVLDPIRVSSGLAIRRAVTHSGSDDAPLDPRVDTPAMLAFWVRAMVEEWPSVLSHLEREVPGWVGCHTLTSASIRLPADSTRRGDLVVVHDAIDCVDVLAMVELLTREIDRILEWEDGRFVDAFRADLEAHAAACYRAAHPGRDDRIRIGQCPTCQRDVRVKAGFSRRRVPVPTTDPKRHPPWESVPDPDPLVRCRCGDERTVSGWHRVICPDERRLTAEEIVDAVHAAYGVRYQPVTVRVWAKRGMIERCGYASDGRALYNRVQVLTALMAREMARA